MGYESLGLASGLEELVALARYEHVTRAAEQLGIPQPTLSRSLARLSAQLGTPVLRREGRGVRLTRHGSLLAEHAERALRELLAGVRAVRAEADPDHGAVVLGFLDSMGPAVVPTLLGSFRDARPGVTVRLAQGSSEELLEQVITGSVDLAIAAPVPRHRVLRSRALAEQSLILLVPSGHRLAARRRLRLRELVGQPLITLTVGYGLRALTDRLLRSARVPAEFAFEAQELTTAAGLVAAGLGVAVLPAGFATSGTVEIAIADPGASRTVCLAWAGDRAVAAPVAALRQHVVDQAPGLLAGRQR